MAVIAEVSIIGLGPQGEAIVNVLGYASDGGTGDSGTMLALCNAVQDDLLGAFQAVLTTDWHGFVIRAAVVVGGPLGATAEIDITGQNGSAAPPSAPLQTCAIIRKHTDSGGRHGRGRAFISPIKASLVDVNGRVTSTNADLQALALAMSQELTPVEGSFRPVIINRTDGVPTTIVSCSVSNVAGVMRSRRLRFPN